LETAVKAFQGRHQLDPDGVVTKTVINEADVPADKRLRQIRLSLQRYRESEARDPGTGFYIFVNIAFQTLWAMDGGEPIAKHRVIVGNNDSDTDQLTMMKGKINRTKLFSHKMSRVILAPKWFPTQRVVELELQPKLAKDPSFLEKEGYVREVQPDGTEVWYQKAGKANLLGDVKFQGPNKFNIYLHDTPFRALFGKARRPFSHGCVRVDKPLDLAELVLGRDQNMSPKAIRDIIKEKEEKEIRLKTQIPVHIDYASAGVDEDGNAIFGYDVYGYDAAAYEGALPVEEAKEFKAGSTRGL
jgi:murein L,D-transpeptidase YcbB/YkuD